MADEENYESGSSEKSQEHNNNLFLRIRELEAEAEQRKNSELKMMDSFSTQTKELEQTKILLENSKLQIDSLQQKVKKLENSSHTSHQKHEDRHDMNELKNQLKSATEAEENSRKAMDDLASALKEVATESNQFKQKLKASEAELDFMKDEVNHLKSAMRMTENRYKKLLDESRKEIELLKREGDRLRFEAEESISTWNGKEIGFVDCIKRAEEDKIAAQKENSRLVQSIRMAESKNLKSKEENQKLRDILKQALNEANAAKEAAEIAKAENSQLKDAISEKENELILLRTEFENLKINESAAIENNKQLKRLISEESTDPKKERNGSKKVSQIFSFNLKELKFAEKQRDQEEAPEIDETLKGSIFDEVNSPLSANHYQKKPFSPFFDDGETLSSDDLDGNGDRSSRKKSALLTRFGDIIRRRNLQRKETPFD